MRKIRGLAHVASESPSGGRHYQEVFVSEGILDVMLTLKASYPALLTTDEARYLAHCLVEAANTVDLKMKTMPNAAAAKP